MNSQIKKEPDMPTAGSESTIFLAGLEGFDGSRPYAVIQTLDPIYNERLEITCKTPEDFMASWTKMSGMTRGEQHTWNGKYLFHSSDGPAVKFYNGSEAWFDRGLIHNSKGPSVKFGGKQLFSLNGVFVPEEYFGYYTKYIENLAKARHPTGLIPTFPSKSEIIEAVEHGLILYFDYSINFHWYDSSGLRHHPTGAAYSGADGTTQYWSHGTKLGEMMEFKSRDSIFSSMPDDVIGSPRTKYRFYTVEDVLEADDIDELAPLFKEAANRLIDGDSTDETFEWFRVAYGYDFDRDFSQSFVDRFPEMVEDICEELVKRTSPFARVSKKSISEIDARSQAGRMHDRAGFISSSSQAAREVILDSQVSQGSSKVSSLEADKLASEQEWSLKDRLDALVEMVNKIEANKAVDSKQAQLSTTKEDEQDPLSQPYAEKVQLMDPPMAGFTERKAASVILTKISDDTEFGGYVGKDNQRPVEAPASKQDGQESNNSDWGVSLGCLAVAGLVGLLGSKKEAIDVAKEVKKEVESVTV